MTIGSVQSEQTMHSVRQYRRAEPAALPFFPYGLVPLAGLVALLFLGWGLVAHAVVQNTARTVAEQALAEAGESWARVQVSGQWVTLEGTPPAPEAAQRAVEIVRRAGAPTWLGDARPVTRVTTRFGEAAPESAPAQANSLSTPAARASSPQFLFRLNAGTMTLDGRVPTGELSAALTAAARAHLRTPNLDQVINRLEITGGATPNGFDVVARRGIEGLVKCQSGTANFSDQTFNFRCEAQDDDVNQINEFVRAGLPLGAFGRVEVLPIEAVTACEEELSHLLEAARIEFAPGSAVINVASGPVLDLAARAASDCPGTLRVEGHTDSTGNASINRDLSLQRAEAVRRALVERGVPSERLIAEGYGAERPVGDNATDDGRARNRRIEIRIIRPVE